MRIGKLNKRIIIQKRKTAKDDYGQQIASWVQIAECWAEIRPIDTRAGGTETVEAHRLQNTQTHTVCIHFTPDLMPPVKAGAYRILYATSYGDRYLNITAARDLNEGHKWIVFECEEGSVDGD